MINKILDILGFKISFTDDDSMYKNLKLRDYGLDKYTYLKNDNDLSNIFLYYDDINPVVYKKFESKYFWSKVIKKNNYYLTSYIISILFCIITLLNTNYITLSFSALMIILTLILRRILLINIRTYKMYKCISDIK